MHFSSYNETNQNKSFNVKMRQLSSYPIWQWANFSKMDWWSTAYQLTLAGSSQIYNA